METEEEKKELAVSKKREVEGWGWQGVREVSIIFIHYAGNNVSTQSRHNDGEESLNPPVLT